MRDSERNSRPGLLEDMSMRLTLAIATILVTACGGPDATEPASSAAEQSQTGSGEYAVTIRNESGQESVMNFKYWIVRPIEYGTNYGWWPIENQKVANGETRTTTLVVPDGERVAVQLTTWAGGRAESVHNIAAPRGELLLSVGQDGRPSLTWSE
ncbi:hypothetical protein Mx8p59 [Myxococcus phage Mx8]|uniref:p59 n=1 Tax=Myxococcus phage Mx8 TaxID=49964 RepID=Q94MR0_9CAUD|nr:hypothetical protein Mx8p59 [Myxococcus phage Mx8]AAK94394.1 p59 [Myxococcus phage Mx8]